MSFSSPFTVDIFPFEFLPIDPQPDAYEEQPVAAKTNCKSEPPNPVPPDDDVLTKEDFYKILENFKNESLDLFKLKLKAQSS